jgi:hypothetical protein
MSNSPQLSALSPQPKATAAEEAAGRAAYEAFYAKMEAWLPSGYATQGWSVQAEAIRTAWIEAAKAARSL